MAKTFEGNIKLASAIAQTGAQPLDDRVVVKSKSDLYNSFGTAHYLGMQVVVTDDSAAYILINDASVASADGWKKVGDGKGTIQAADYNAAVALATNDNIGQIIYALADCSVGESTYQSGPYMVTGVGTLVKLAQSSPSGELEPRVSALETRMGKADASIGTLETAVGKIKDSSAEDVNNGVSVKVETKEGNVTSVVVDASGVATAAQGAKADSAIQGAKAGDTSILVEDNVLKFGTMAAESADNYLKTEDTSIFTAEEKTKLATVVENAQLNHIKVNGENVGDVSYGADGKRYQNIQITEGTNNGTIAVNGTDISVKGLGSAAFEASTAFDANGAAHDVSVYVDAELAKKVNVADSSNFTKAEKDKLAAIEEGAEVNIIETVKVNGTALTVADKAVNVEIPAYAGENAIAVSDVADNSAKVSLKLNDVSILSQDANGLKATLSIAYNDQKIQLKGIEGKLISEFDASMFIKDGMIEDVSLIVITPEEATTERPAGTYLKITFNTAAGKQPIWVNVTSLIDVYTAGNGIEINNKAISVKKDAGDEGYLTVSETGVKVTGVNAAIAAAVEGLAKDASLQAVSGKLNDVSTALDAVITNLAKTDVSLADVSSRLATANTKITDVSTALDIAIANLAKTDSSLADVSARLATTDVSLATEKGRMDTLLEELAGNTYIKKVSIASDCSALTATTDSSGYVTIGISEQLQSVLDGFDAKLDADDITTGTANGTIAVSGTDVAVKGLKTAAYEDSSAFLAYDSMDWQVLS